MSDVDLARLRAGDDALFSELIRAYSPRLLPYLRRFARADVGVEDLLQEVWLRAYRKRETFEGRGSFFGWLLSIGRTVGISAAGRGGGPPHEAIQASRSDEASDAALLRDAIRSAVLRLPERQREVVLLRLVEDLSTAETAARLNCAEGTVKATLHQATRRLRELLREEVR